MADFTTVAPQTWATLITMPKTHPNGLLDPSVIYTDDSGNIQCAKKDLSELRPLFAGTSANANSVVIRSEFDTTASKATTNEGNISANATSIGNNASDITANTTSITTNGTAIGTNTGNISTNVTNITANQTTANTNAAGISTNAADIATNLTQITASYETLKIDVDFDGVTRTSTTTLNATARVSEVRFEFDGTADQRTPDENGSAPTLQVHFQGGAAGSLLDWTSQPGVEIPAEILLHPQWTLNDTGNKVPIEVVMSNTTFGAVPAFSIVVVYANNPLS